MTRRQFGLPFAAWMVGVGAAGWILVFFPHIVGIEGVPPFPLAAFAVFLATGAASALLSIEIRPGISLAIDGVFLAAAAIAMGPVWTVYAWALSALLHSIWVWHRRPGMPRWAKLLRLVYQPGLAGGIVLLAAGVLGLGPGPARALPNALWLAPTFGAVCLVVHYLVQFVGFALQGFRTSELRGTLGPALALELGILPVSSALVHAYPVDGRGLGGFAFVAGTYLLVNLAFRIAIRARERARHAAELEALALVTRDLSAALDIADLVPRLRDATFSLLPADRFVLGFCMPDDEAPRVACYDREGRTVPRSPGLSALEASVMRTQSASRISDSSRIEPPVARPGAWMGFPLAVSGETFGILAVECDRAGVFGRDDARRGAALATQASIALENARLYSLATVDGLTGLYVRRYFDQRVTEETAHGRREGTPFCVIMLDLDDFSEVNDGHGHAAGDEILRRTADALRAELRGSDVAARHGGEEFAVLLPRTRIEEAARVAERILAGIRSTFVPIGGGRVRVTASAGVAQWSPFRPDVVARADDLLYVAKRAGKDAVALDAHPEPELRPPRGLRGRPRRRASPLA